MKKIYRIGEIRESNDCGPMEIIEYNGALDMKVKFKTGTIVKNTYGNFKKGEIKDPLYPNIHGKGYSGIGLYKCIVNNKISKAYAVWRDMLARCYNPYIINKLPTYRDVVVCKEWYNFQTFAKWYEANHYTISNERIELDKDLIKRGNKVYCPQYCSFVPQAINKLLLKKDQLRGKYPIGVLYDGISDRYVARLNINSKRKHLGCFATPEEAFYAYKKAKEKRIKKMAWKYKDVLDRRVYKALMRYRVQITD